MTYLGIVLAGVVDVHLKVHFGWYWIHVEVLYPVGKLHHVVGA